VTDYSRKIIGKGDPELWVPGTIRGDYSIKINDKNDLEEMDSKFFFYFRVQKYCSFQ
jgi:nucleoside diphosphate kinase